MPRHYTDKVNTYKPKLTPIKAIQKFMIVHDIKFRESPPVYYSWDEKRQPKWIETQYGWFPEEPYITVDYDIEKREWYIGFIIDPENRKFATIDDITGRCDILTTD